MAPPDEDASVLQQQIEETKVTLPRCQSIYDCDLLATLQAFSQEVTAKQPEYDRVMAEGQNLIQLAHPRAVALLQSHLQQLERAWVDLRGRVGETPYGIVYALHEIHVYNIYSSFLLSLSFRPK